MSHFFGSSVYPTVTFANLPTAATANAGMIFNVSDAGINGSLWRSNGTLWAPLNGSAVLAQSSQPWIVLSSGSIAAGGTISGITALTLKEFPKAWCWFPANAVATVSAAGWRYCTFSTTTAGIAFLDQPSATFPVAFPSSPTAVTDGKGSYTGASGSPLSLPTVALPAGIMGINGRLVLQASTWQTNSAPQLFFFIAGSSGTSVSGTAQSTDWSGVIQNAGVNNFQSENVSSIGGSTGRNWAATDTSAATTTKIALQNAAAANNFELIGFSISLQYGQ